MCIVLKNSNWFKYVQAIIRLELMLKISMFIYGKFMENKVTIKIN